MVRPLDCLVCARARVSEQRARATSHQGCLKNDGNVGCVEEFDGVVALLSTEFSVLHRKLHLESLLSPRVVCRVVSCRVVCLGRDAAVL